MHKYKIFIVLFTAIFTLPVFAQAEQCNFTRDLEYGSVGGDVKCLQKFLNSSGFKISQSGAGSPGKETTTFYENTKQALKNWQKANSILGTGYFGPVSRQKYKSLSSSTNIPISGTQNTANVSLSKAEIQARINDILAQINKLKDKRDETRVNEADQKTDAKQSIDELKSAISDARTKVDEAYKNGKSVDRSNELLKDAQDKATEANREYKNLNYKNAINLSDQGFDLVDSALTKIGITSTTKAEARLELDKAESTLKDAREKIRQADVKGESVDNSNDIIDKAENRFTEAESAFDNKDYARVSSLADQIEELAEDAVDAIGKSETKDAERASRNAISALNSAKSSINSSNYTSGYNYLENARQYINEARGSLNSGSFEDAYEHLSSARTNTIDAQDYAKDEQSSNTKNSIDKAIKELESALKDL